MVKITCNKCGKQLSIDETKLPMKEVKFPCPQCKADQFFDRSKMGEASEAAPVAPSEPTAVSSEVVADDEDEFGLPQAMLVGKEAPGIRDAVKSLGLNLKVFPTAEAARDFYYREYPHLVILCPNEMTQPPLQEMTAILSVSPVDRRKGFFVLVADNLRTLDGNAAFLYNVSLVVASKDIAQFKKIYNEAHRFHENLYKQMTLLNEG